MNVRTKVTILSMAAPLALGLGACDPPGGGEASSQARSLEDPFVGAVYAMTNDTVDNEVVAWGRHADGTLTLIGSFPTGGVGAILDGGEGLDPLISAYSLITADDGRFVLAVNAGSGTLTSFAVGEDYGLTAVSTASIPGLGPNTIAYRDGIVYVANIEQDGVFTGVGDMQGSLAGYLLDTNGVLSEIPDSIRSLSGRPAAIRMSPDGDFLVASIVNAGAAGLGSDDELEVFAIGPDGTLSDAPVGSGTSKAPGDDPARNLPTGFGFEIVEQYGLNFVIVTEAREIGPDGQVVPFPDQTGSVSTFVILPHGGLVSLWRDVLTGTSVSDGQQTACWLDFSADGEYFWVSNGVNSSLSAFHHLGWGKVKLIDELAAQGTPGGDDPSTAFEISDGWIDLAVSPDGEFLYQLFGLDGTIGVFEIGDHGSLTAVQEVGGDLPPVNTQGIAVL